MAKEILIKIRNKIAERIDGEYVCGNSDFVAVFDFDEEWSAYETKTARIDVGEDEPYDIVFNGNRCEIPILKDIHSFYIGVYAGNLRTSTPAYVPARKSILCKGGTPAAPKEDVYAQIMAMLNSMGSVSDEEVREAVEKYLAENPINEKDPTVSDWAKQPNKPSYTAAEVGAATSAYVDNAIANLPTGGASPMKLIYDKTFEQVNSISDTLEGLKDYKRILYLLYIFNRKEQLTIQGFNLDNVVQCYWTVMKTFSEPYPYGCIVGEMENHDNFTFARRYYNNIATNPEFGSTSGMSVSATSIAIVQGRASNNEIWLQFGSEAVADVRLKIWGC